MSVTELTTRISLAGDGSNQEFPFAFPIVDTSDLKVILRTNATGVEAVLTETTNYSVSAPNLDYSSGGTVTTVSTYSSAYTIVIMRDTPITQSSDLSTDSGVLRLDALVAALDKLTKIAQEHQEVLDRSLRFPRTDSTSLTSELPDSVERASETLIFDSSGNADTE